MHLKNKPQFSVHALCIVGVNGSERTYFVKGHVSSFLILLIFLSCCTLKVGFLYLEIYDVTYN